MKKSVFARRKGASVTWWQEGDRRKERLTSGESVRGVVGSLDELLLGGELHETSDRTERLLRLHERTSKGDVEQDGRRKEVRSELGQGLSSNGDLGSLRDGVLDVLLDLGHGPLVDDGSVRGSRVERVAELERSDLCDELLGELVVDVLVDEDSVGADARLAGQSELGRDESVNGLGNVGVGKDGEDGVSSQLERAPGWERERWSVSILSNMRRQCKVRTS